MILKKIFVIGFNKTATSTFHKLFLINGLKSQHSSEWNHYKYNCFSDNGPMNDFKKLYKYYPNATFILNTRCLKDWLISRFKHGYNEYLENNINNWAYPTTVDKAKLWIIKRENYYKEVLEFFEMNPQKLIIVNIDNKNWIDFISDILNLEIRNVKPQNVSNKLDNKIIKEVVDDTFKTINYSVIQQNQILLDNETNDKYLQIYKNNIL